jgi:hypothetical protein
MVGLIITLPGSISASALNKVRHVPLLQEAVMKGKMGEMKWWE